MKIQKEHLSWLSSVPATDINFKMHLKEANEETIKKVLKENLPKNKRKILESKLKKIQKENIPYY